MNPIGKIYLNIVVFISSLCCLGADNLLEIESPICGDFIGDLASIGILINIEDINNNDASGQKSGLWIDVSEYYLIMTHYVNGQKEGTERTFSRCKKELRPQYIVSYNRNTMQSIIGFDEKTGLISVLVDNIKTNDESINYPDDWTPGHSFPSIGYSRYFNPYNGQL